MGRQPAGRSGADDLRARAIAWVEQACADQKVSAKVTDPLVLERVAELLAQGRESVNRDSSKRL
jgi:hypothetical protein